MSSQPSPQPRVAFDAFDFSPASGELRKHGRAVRLQGQPLQILAALLAEPGEMVTRETLQQRLWSGAVAGDFEHGLNAAVNKLRQALNDSADEPRFVETIPGRGYRFIAAAIQAPRAVLEMTPAREPRVQPRQLPRWAPWAALLPVAGALGYWLGAIQPQPRAPLAQFVITPPPGFFLQGATSRQSLAVSRDGAHIAYQAMDASGLFRIFLRDVTSLESREVPDSVGAGSLFWLPGRSLVFAARGKVRRHNLGEPGSQILSETQPGFFAGDVLPDGRLLLTQRFKSTALPVSGGALEHLKAAYPWAQRLPDSDYLLLAGFDPDRLRWRIRAERYGDPASMREILTADSRAIYSRGHLLYARGGALLAQPFDVASLRATGEASVIVPRVYTFMPAGSSDFSASANGELLVYQTVVHRSQPIWVDRTGRKLRDAGPGGVSTKDARLSPDGSRFASAIFDHERGGVDIWVTETATGQARKLIAGPGNVNAPVWSPDGKQLAFMRAAQTTPRLFARALEAPHAERSLAGPDWQVPTDWLAGGRFVLYNNTGQTLVENEGQSDIWSADLERGGQLAPLIRTQFHEANAAASPDGRWIAFTSNESGRPEMYVQRLEVVRDTLRVAGERQLVSRGGAVCLRWRKDGKELFYLASNGRVQAVAVTPGPKLGLGAPQPLFTIGADAIASVHSLIGFDAAADGQSFVIPSVTAAAPSALVAVQNWQGLLQ